MLLPSGLYGIIDSMKTTIDKDNGMMEDGTLIAVNKRLAANNRKQSNDAFMKAVKNKISADIAYSVAQGIESARLDMDYQIEYETCLRWQPNMAANEQSMQLYKMETILTAFNDDNMNAMTSWLINEIGVIDAYIVFKPGIIPDGTYIGHIIENGEQVECDYEMNENDTIVFRW